MQCPAADRQAGIKGAVSSDQDCMEDLRVYPTRCSQEVIDRAVSVKAGTAELLCAYIDVEPVGYNRGFYTVDVRYFYRITADAFVGAARPVEITGLVVFDKRVILFGSEGGAKVFSSADHGDCDAHGLSKVGGGQRPLVRWSSGRCAV